MVPAMPESTCLMRNRKTWCNTPVIATLKFSLPEETVEYHAAVHGLAYRAALGSIREQLRQKLKHGHRFATPDEAMDWVHQLVITACRDSEEPPDGGI